MPEMLHFLRPQWFLALIPLAGAVFWLLRRRPGLRRWADVVDSHLAPHVLVGTASKASRWPVLALAVAGCLAVVALAGPVWKQLPQPVFSSQNALVIVLDLSRSMNTQDIKPSRIDRARFKVADLLAQRDEGQAALIVYAATSFVVSPLTDDVNTISSQLSALAPELMPSQGSRADVGLLRAYELLQQANRKRGDVLLVTDGVDVDRTEIAIRQLVEGGYRVSVLGVGTPEGGPVPTENGFLRNRDGAIVVARLNRDDLRAVASSGGGIYHDLSADNSDIERLTGVLEQRMAAQSTARDLTADIWREEGPWLVLLVLPFAALAFRRGILAVAAIAFMLPMTPAEAGIFDNFWKTADQRAAEALAKGKASKAAELFQDPTWKGAAEYRAGDYEDAVEVLAQLDSVDATYNRGNALARLGRFDEAIAAYDEVLEQDPQHTDAQFNRQLLLEQMQQDNQQSDPGESDNQDQQQSDEGNEGESSDSEQQQGESDSENQTEAEQQQAGESDSEDQSEQQQAGESESDDREPDELTEEQKQAMAQLENEQDEESEEQQVARELLASDPPPDEEQQAIEQWLRRIPDDPGGLLRRKFLYQYQRQQQPPAEEEQW